MLPLKIWKWCGNILLCLLSLMLLCHKAGVLYIITPTVYINKVRIKNI